MYRANQNGQCICLMIEKNQGNGVNDEMEVKTIRKNNNNK